MAAGKEGINLKVFLEPELQNLKKVQNDLGNTIKDLGDSKLTKQFDSISQKISGLDNVFENIFDISTFKNVSKEMQNIFNEIQKITSSMGNLDAAKGFNELEQKILSVNKEIAITEERMKKIKTGGRIDKESKSFSFFEKDLNTKVVGKNIKRIDGVKGAGTPGSQIKTYASLIKYKEKMEVQQQTENDTYKEICNLVDEIKKDEAKKTVEYKEQLVILNKQKTTLSKMQDEAKKIVSKPVSSDKQDEKTIKIQTELNKTYADAMIGKSKIIEQTKKGIEADKDVQEAQEKTGKEIENTTKSQEKQDGVIGKAIKNFTSYTLVLGTMKRALRSAVQTVRVLDNALVEQAMVSGKNKKELQGLLKTYQDIGIATGATTKEVAEVATQYFRQGKTIKDTKILTEAAVAAAKVGAISTADSVDYLTTAINGFGMAAEDATRVSDRFSALAANSATNYEELAVALSKVASQAHLAEMSMDFTLGLLAKGIETTREAPETIGTALKTIIARMREMTDYGKTLEDGISVNNLETQLKYVGIALRDSNGELRSSESVLDEVGRSWDTFNANQQAALAKAFAGTRQQSRFISMMQDYDRTLELVNISQESNGATMAQMSTYMQGIEASLNKVTVGWENLITTFIKSDTIVGIVDIIGNALESVNLFFSDGEQGAARMKAALVGIGLVLGVISLNMLGIKAQQRMESVEQTKNAQAQYMATLEQNKADEIAILNAEKESKINALQLKQKQLQTTLNNLNSRQQDIINEKKKIALKLEEAQNAAKRGDLVTARKLTHQAEIDTTNLQAKEANIKKYTKQINKQVEENEKNLKIEQEREVSSKKLEEINKAISSEKLAQSKIGQHLLGFYGLYNMLTQIGTTAEIARLMILKKQTKEKATQIAMEKAANPMRALAGAAVLAGVVALGFAVKGIADAVKEADPEYQKKKRREENKESNAEIYKLTQKKTKIDSVTSAYERYNKEIIKTKESQEELNKQLDAAAETLDEEQKAEYDSYKTTKERYDFLQKINQKNIDDLKTKRDANREKFRKQDAKSLIQDIDEDAATKTNVVDVIASGISLKSGLQNSGKIKNLLEEQLLKMGGVSLQALVEEGADTSFLNEFGNALGQTLAGSETNLLDALETGSLEERRDAFKQLEQSIHGNDQALQLLTATYGDLQNMVNSFDDDTFEIFTKRKYDVKFINRQMERLKELLGEGFSTEDFSKLLQSEDMLEYLRKEHGLQLDDETVAGNIIQDLLYGPKGSEQQVAQDITSFENQIKSLYETQSKWATMSAEEQRKFIEDHATFFSDPEAYEKFINGQDISEDLHKFLLKDQEEILETLNTQIEAYKVQEKTAKTAEERSLAATKRAEAEKRRDYIATGKVFRQDLEVRLKKEKDALDAFKDILSKEKDELIKTLEEQKKAYQEYFDAIDKAAQDSDYFEERDKLISNITRLGAGTDAASVSKSQDLQNKLQELENERLQTLKQRGRDAIIENISKEIEAAQESLDDIKNNSQKMLDIMSNGENITNMLKAGAVRILGDSNMTGLEKEKALNDLLAQVSPFLLEKGVKIDQNAFQLQNDGKTLIFNVNGQEQTIDLNQDLQDNLWDVIQRILGAIGQQ